jgi:hypothetical protein
MNIAQLEHDETDKCKDEQDAHITRTVLRGWPGCSSTPKILNLLVGSHELLIKTNEVVQRSTRMLETLQQRLDFMQSGSDTCRQWVSTKRAGGASTMPEKKEGTELETT